MLCDLVIHYHDNTCTCFVLMMAQHLTTDFMPYPYNKGMSKREFIKERTKEISGRKVSKSSIIRFISKSILCKVHVELKLLMRLYQLKLTNDILSRNNNIRSPGFVRRSVRTITVMQRCNVGAVYGFFNFTLVTMSTLF